MRPPAPPAVAGDSATGASFAPELTWSEGTGPGALQRFVDNVATRNQSAELARSITPLTLQASPPQTAPAPSGTTPAATPAHVQRTPEFAGHEATGEFSQTVVNRVLPVDDIPIHTPAGTRMPEDPDLSAITEHVWREIRRRLRVERERTRGVM